jgi:poly(3-hydroxybutyrate) depolymerase
VNWWIRANKADASNAKTEALPDVVPDDGCSISRTLYPALAGGAPVLFYLAKGGGHTMPSQTETSSEGGPLYKILVGRTCRDVDGPSIAWEFMSGYSTNSHQLTKPVQLPAAHKCAATNARHGEKSAIHCCA